MSKIKTTGQGIETIVNETTTGSEEPVTIKVPVTIEYSIEGEEKETNQELLEKLIKNTLTTSVELANNPYNADDLYTMVLVLEKLAGINDTYILWRRQD